MSNPLTRLDQPNPGPQVTDPVCGMAIEPAQAKGSLDHAGSIYYFCSQGCMKKFEADPGAFKSPDGSKVSMKESAPVSNRARFVCPMHPEVRQDH